jgi:hypothetical protein
MTDRSLLHGIEKAVPANTVSVRFFARGIAMRGD